jgi:hypothetical protein
VVAILSGVIILFEYFIDFIFKTVFKGYSKACIMLYALIYAVIVLAVAVLCFNSLVLLNFLFTK